jgi:ABC-type dipeptide/oligopeptide/nickel transport system permease subunit
VSGGRAGVVLAVLLAAFVVGGAAVQRPPADAVDYTHKLQGPSLRAPLGTDQFGRDQLARLIEGGRRSLLAAVLVLLGALAIGLLVGLTAGLAGGALGALLMRGVDVMLALPPLVLALAVIGVLGPGFGNLLLALVAAGWAPYARLTRGLVLGAHRRPDVIAARLAGVRWPRIVGGHVLPGVLNQLGVVASLSLGEVIVGIAGLSFLGLGAQPPAAEWGAMLADSRSFFSIAPWLLIGPSALILVAVLAANLCGDALREARRDGRR